MTRPIIDLDLAISGARSPYTLAAHMRDPASASVVELLADAALPIADAALRAAELDPPAYGRLLAATVFSERSIWDRVEAYAAGKQADVRLRLRFAKAATALHALRWERLCDPNGRFIAADGKVTLLRYVPTENAQAVATPSYESLRALIAVACPIDSGQFDLSAFDTAAEHDRALTALSGAPWIAALAPDAPAGRATPQRLNEMLRLGCDLLYLACHGTLSPTGEPTLWLENDDGTSKRLAGAELVRQIAALDAERQPVLVILAVCQSAGNDDPAAAGAALGPMLARAGIPAVIAMQGLAPIDLVARFVPTVLSELFQHGSIDRAVAIARADLPLTTAWWLPVLYTRIEDGQVWHPTGQPVRAPLSIAVSTAAPRSQTIRTIHSELMLRGLALQPDLGHADGSLLHITADRIEDERECEAAVNQLRRATREHGTPVLVVRDGVSRRALRSLVNPADLGWTELAIEDDMDEPGELRAVANEMLRIVSDQYAAQRISGGAISIGLTAFDQVAFTTPPTLLLDWTTIYKDGYPTPERWRTQLLPALADVRQILKAKQVRQIDLSGRARLGMGLAFGYAFREVTETVLRVRQGPTWWRTATHNPRLKPFGEAVPTVLSDEPDLTVELNINRAPGEVSAFVDAYLRTAELPIGQRLKLELPSGPATHLGERDAQAIVAQVRTLIQQHRRPGGTTHLFMAGPLGVAVLLGWHLNALTPVQYYELPEGSGMYEPACRLGAL